MRGHRIILKKMKEVSGRKRGPVHAPRKTEKLKVLIQDEKGENVTCVIPVQTILSKRHVGFGVKKSTINYKLMHRKNEEGKWGILNAVPSFSSPQRLINTQIVVSNGKRTVVGKVIKANLITSGGGATSPATGDGLPPVDE